MTAPLLTVEEIDHLADRRSQGLDLENFRRLIATARAYWDGRDDLKAAAEVLDVAAYAEVDPRELIKTRDEILRRLTEPTEKEKS